MLGGTLCPQYGLWCTSLIHFITHMYMKLYMLDATYAAVHAWSLTFMDKDFYNLHCITPFSCSQHTMSFTECLAHST
jgi:hypothetical protein